MVCKLAVTWLHAAVLTGQTHGVPWQVEYGAPSCAFWSIGLGLEDPQFVLGQPAVVLTEYASCDFCNGASKYFEQDWPSVDQNFPKRKQTIEMDGVTRSARSSHVAELVCRYSTHAAKQSHAAVQQRVPTVNAGFCILSAKKLNLCSKFMSSVCSHSNALKAATTEKLEEERHSSLSAAILDAMQSSTSSPAFHDIHSESFSLL